MRTSRRGFAALVKRQSPLERDDQPLKLPAVPTATAVWLPCPSLSP
jgi:hypothetical protein